MRSRISRVLQKFVANAVDFNDLAYFTADDYVSHNAYNTYSLQNNLS
jgi:hypothetical protein